MSAAREGANPSGRGAMADKHPLLGDETKRPRWADDPERKTRGQLPPCVNPTKAEWHRVVDLHSLSSHCAAPRAAPVPNQDPFPSLLSCLCLRRLPRIQRWDCSSCWQEAAPGSVLL